MKNTRHDMIINIVKGQVITTQEELLQALSHENVTVTQATLSRDIKQLGLIKTVDNRSNVASYKYIKDISSNSVNKNIQYLTILKQAVISFDFAVNIVVIKCHVGMANAACAAIDNMDFTPSVGTIAGDDTIFVVLKNEEQAKNYVQKLIELDLSE